VKLPAGSSAASSAGPSDSRLGVPVYGEAHRRQWRAWNPNRSKLGAMLEMGMETGLAGGETVLYLGAASGTTVSHVADFAGPTYAVEFAARQFRDLLEAAESRNRLFRSKGRPKA